MIHDARLLTGQRERSPDSGKNGQWGKGEPLFR